MGMALCIVGDKRCQEVLHHDEIERRLNEYETSKKATDALSAEHARYLLHQYKLFAEKLAVYTIGWEPLRAYADILKDG